MKSITIPGTDLSVSSLCFGTGDMGTAVDRLSSFKLLDYFVEQGGNFIDTARVYGDWVPNIERGMSEKVIGEWLRERGCRGNIVLATKGAHPRLDTPKIPRLSRREILDDLTASLMALGTDCIDLYWLHRDDPRVPVADILDILHEQERAGTVRYYAASNWTPVRLRLARAYAQERGYKGFVADQTLWNLGVPAKLPYGDPTCGFMDEERFIFHEETGMAAIPYQSQAFGLFHRLQNGSLDQMNPGIRDMFRLPESLRRFERLQEIMRHTSLTITQVVLGYLLSQPFVTIPIIGCKTPAHLSDSLTAADTRLTPELVRFLIHG